MKKATLGRTEMTPIDSIKPYWRNPRRISDEAIEQLAHSIQEYGYQQPLVVDEKNVLIVGHTRYAAMRRLGVETVQVMIADHLTPKQVKQFRLIDNRAAEYTTWDPEVLAEQLAALEDPERIGQFFPEALAQDVLDAEENLEIDLETFGEDDAQVLEFICPSCYFTWDARVTGMAMMAGFISKNDAVEASERGEGA